MNANRAMEIMRNIEALSGIRKEYPMAYWEARGYLAALAGPEVKGLVEALQSGHKKLNSANSPSQAIGLMAEVLREQFEALAAFNKAVGP